MATNKPTITAKQQAILDHIRQYQPISNRQLAKQFNCASATMTTHLMHLARAGLARSTGRAGQTRWHADRRPFTEPVERTESCAPPRLIEQVSSVWHYAQRCARKEKA